MLYDCEGRAMDSSLSLRMIWAIDGLLPTFLGVSTTAASNVWMSLLGFVLF